MDLETNYLMYKIRKKPYKTSEIGSTVTTLTVGGGGCEK